MKHLFFLYLAILCTFTDTSGMIAFLVAADQIALISRIKFNKSLGHSINEPYNYAEYKVGKTYDNLTPLQIACHKNNVAAAEFLLSLPEIKVNAHRPDTPPPLCICMKPTDKKRRDIMRLLITHHDINVNVYDNQKNTPLHRACHLNNLDAVEELLDRKDIQINALNERGKTPLHYACARGFIGIVKLLVNKKCLLDIQENLDLQTPLFIASERGYTEIVKILLQNGADSTLANKDKKHKKTPIIIAGEKDHVDIVDFFLQNNVNPISNKFHLLHHTAIHKSIRTMKFLVTSLNITEYPRDKYNNTPLHLCCYENYKEGVELLLNKMGNLDIDIQNVIGKTALHICARRARNLISLLMDNGASTVIKDDEQETPLAYYFTTNPDPDPAILQQMALGIDHDGNTQLHLYATAQEDFDSYLQMLVNNGVSVWQRNNTHQLAVDLAYNEYRHARSEYDRMKQTPLADILDNRERVLHSYLRINSLHISCQAFKELFTKFNLLPELQQHIMRYFYKVNVETIIARKYKNNKKYYEKHIPQKDAKKQNLITKPEMPHLLWRDA